LQESETDLLCGLFFPFDLAQDNAFFPFASSPFRLSSVAVFAKEPQASVAICFNLAEMLLDSWTIRPFAFNL
jgi:hypothetical protein